MVEILNYVHDENKFITSVIVKDGEQKYILPFTEDLVENGIFYFNNGKITNQSGADVSNLQELIDQHFQKCTVSSGNIPATKQNFKDFISGYEIEVSENEIKNKKLPFNDFAINLLEAEDPVFIDSTEITDDNAKDLLNKLVPEQQLATALQTNVNSLADLQNIMFMGPLEYALTPPYDAGTPIKINDKHPLVWVMEQKAQMKDGQDPLLYALLKMGNDKTKDILTQAPESYQITAPDGSKHTIDEFKTKVASAITNKSEFAGLDTTDLQKIAVNGGFQIDGKDTLTYYMNQDNKQQFMKSFLGLHDKDQQMLEYCNKLATNPEANKDAIELFASEFTGGSRDSEPFIEAMLPVVLKNEYSEDLPELHKFMAEQVLHTFFRNPESFTTEVGQEALKTAAEKLELTKMQSYLENTHRSNDDKTDIIKIYESLDTNILADDNQQEKFNEIYQKFLKKEHGTGTKILDKDSELAKFMQKSDAAERLNSNKWQSQVAGQDTNIAQDLAIQKIYASCDLETLSELKKFGTKQAATNGKDPYSLTTGEIILVALASIVGLIIGGVALHSHFKEKHQKQDHPLQTELQGIVTSSEEAPAWAKEATGNRISTPNKNLKESIGKFTEGVVKTTPSTEQQRQ